MARYALVAPNYPSEKSPNELGFIHSRVRAYVQKGHMVDVYVISQERKQYKFENVGVTLGEKKFLKKRLDEIRYDAILVHFLDKDIAEVVDDKKCFIWVHGFEALSWKRRLFNINPRLPLYIIDNTKRLHAFKTYAMNNPQSTFIFVSDWMYKITSTDIHYKIPNHVIIPNYIDSTLFSFQEKDESDRKRILLLRSFANKKYANDISAKFIMELSKKPYFHELDIQFYGKGRLFNKITKKLTRFENVKITERFFSQELVAQLHKEFGVFLCPTRQDAQGVSMCEAMSSGLVPLTSYNTAIPEYVENNKEGLLCKNSDISSFVDAFEKLYYNPQLFLEISKNASQRVQNQCSFENTILKEMELIGSK